MKANVAGKVWQARKGMALLDNAMVKVVSEETLRVEWQHAGVESSGLIDRLLAEQMAKAILKALKETRGGIVMCPECGDVNHVASECDMEG